MPPSPPGDAEAMNLALDGAQRFVSVLCDPVLQLFDAAIADLPADKPGIRLRGARALDPYLSAEGEVGALAGLFLGPRAKPVRLLLFDKTPRRNWRLGWHQDRTIAVTCRVEMEGYGPWSVKAGLQHVAPPFGLLEKMLTV